MLKRHSLFERCVTLPVSTWSVANKQSIRSVDGLVHNLTTSYFERKETSLSATRQPFMVEIALLYVFSLSNSLVFVSFLCSSDRSRTKEQVGSMPSTQAVATSPNYNRDGSEKVRRFDKRAHRHKPFDRKRFVSVLWLCHAQLRDLVEAGALTGECSLPVRECSPPDQNRSIFFFIQTFVDFALSLSGHSL